MPEYSLAFLETKFQKSGYVWFSVTLDNLKRLQTHVAGRPLWPQTVGTKLEVDFSERFDPNNYKIGLEKIFHQCPFF